MKPDLEDTIVERWTEPTPMDIGAPEPFLVEEGDVIWVAYRARDPTFRGWVQPSAIKHVHAQPGEPYGVMRFDGVASYSLGPPSDERLHEHPLYKRGLQAYGFHRIRSMTQDRRWIVTFHDETLEIEAEAATAFPLLFASTPQAAIDAVRQQSA